MILLDADVISELMLGDEASRSVLDWLRAQPQSQLALPSIVVMEVRNGIAVLPAGKKRTKLDELAQRIFNRFAGRIISFDLDAAVSYAPLVAGARSRGVVVGVPDGQIGAIAAAGGHMVAARDTTPFEAMGVRLVNPWAWASA